MSSMFSAHKFQLVDFVFTTRRQFTPFPSGGAKSRHFKQKSSKNFVFSKHSVNAYDRHISFLCDLYIIQFETEKPRLTTQIKPNCLLPWELVAYNKNTMAVDSTA